MLAHKYIALGALAFLVYWEIVRTPPAQTVPNNPANSNSLGLPTAPINASSLSPTQLGTGLFEDPSGLGTQAAATQTAAPQPSLYMLQPILPTIGNAALSAAEST